MKTVLRLLNIFVGIIASGAAIAQPQYFFQDFNSSSSIGSYVGGSTNLFTQLTTSGTGASVSISNGKLVLSRTSNQARFGRSIEFAATPPEYLYVQFKIQINATAALPNVANFYIGGSKVGINSFVDNGSIPTASYATIQFNFVTLATGGTGFRIDGPNNEQGNNYANGEHTITWVLNNSSSRVSYAIPDATGNNSGNNGFVSPDQMVVYVNDELQFGRPIVVNNSNDNMSYFKFLFSQGIGDIIIDDLNFRGRNNFPESVLPVQLLNFTASANPDQAVDVRWSTGSEQNSSHFVLERSASLENFTEIARLDAAGQASSVRQYSFTDRNPLRGINYYRLRQIDTDGSQQLYRPVAVEIGGDVLRVFPNPSSTGEFVLQGPDSQMASIELLSAVGTKIALEHEICSNQERKLRLPAGTPAGMYVLKLLRANGTATHLKVVLR